MTAFQRWLLRWTGRLAPRAIAGLVMAWWCRKVGRLFEGPLAEPILEVLLAGMAGALLLSREYRRRIAGFKARYLFCAADGAFAVQVSFRGGEMHFGHATGAALRDWDVRVTFSCSPALWKFLRSGDDVLGAIVEHGFETTGNLNLLYRFGFLVNDLERRLRLRRAIIEPA